MEKVARERPTVVARVVRKPKVADAIVNDMDASTQVGAAHVRSRSEILGPNYSSKVKAKFTRAADDHDAARATGIAAIPGGPHPAEDMVDDALKILRAAVLQREKFPPNKEQAERMGKQADEVEALALVYRGTSLLSDEDFARLLAE